MDADTNSLMTLRYLIKHIKLELGKMGIDTKKFTVYSIKHSAISYLVKQKVDIKDIEKAMHYKQKNNTTTNHYAVKEASKSVGLLLANAEESNDSNNNNNIINCNSVKNLEIKIDNPQTLDPDVKKVIKSVK
jgi:cbb3-type cytochrome oxidase cytochrome c subunit